MSPNPITESPMKDIANRVNFQQASAIYQKLRRSQDRMLFKVLFYTGRRVSEVVRNMKPEDIDYSSNLVTWRILKKNIRRRKPEEIEAGISKRKNAPKVTLKAIPPRLAQSLHKYIHRNGIGPDDYIFPMSRKTAWAYITKAAAKAGLGTVGRHPVGPRTLRHSFAVEGSKVTDTLDGMIKLQNALDHEKFDTTLFYAQFNPSDQLKLLSRMWKDRREEDD